MRILERTLVAAIVALVSSPAWAVITYIDADPSSEAMPGNTTINGAFVDTTATGNATASTGGGSVTDNKWHLRTLAEFNGGSGISTETWSSDNNAAQDEVTDPLITTFTLPAAGTYNLYGLFWNNWGVAQTVNTGNWDADFRVGAVGAFTHFDKSNAQLLPVTSGLLNTADFDVDLKVRNTNSVTALLMADLGQITVAGPTAIDIYIQGSNPNTALADQRVQYEGIGYQLVPEPSAIVVLGTGIFGWVAARRRVRK
jgi:hypothetical protein